MHQTKHFLHLPQFSAFTMLAPSPEMLKKSNCSYADKQRFFLSGKVLNYCLFFLFAFFLTGLQSSASTVVHHEDCIVHQGLTCHLSEDLYNSAHFPLHLPFGSVPTENEQEPSNKEELKDNFDDDRSLLILKNLSYSIFNASSTVKSHFYQRTQCVQNRSTVPLFILFLSWKSFLL